MSNHDPRIVVVRIPGPLHLRFTASEKPKLLSLLELLVEPGDFEDGGPDEIADWLFDECDYRESVEAVTFSAWRE